MSLARDTRRVAELGDLEPGSPPPGSKRLRLEEPGGASEMAWRLPLVPRLSEVERAWDLAPRPFRARLLSARAIFASSADPRVEKRVGGQQIGSPGVGQNSALERHSWQSGPSASFASGERASRRFSEPARAGRAGAQTGQRPLVAPTPASRREAAEGGERRLVPGGSRRQKDSSYLKLPENALLDVPFYKETESTVDEIQNRCKADSVMPSNRKENNISVSPLKISKAPNQPGMEIAEASYFRDSSPISIPEFSADLNSKMSSVYLKEIAKKENDTNEAYVRDFTNINWSQNRPDVKKRKFQDDIKIVDAGNSFSEGFESSPPSLSNQNTCVREDLISLNYCNHSSIKFDVRDTEKNFTLILENANWGEAETWWCSYLSASLEQSQSWDCNIRCNLRKKRRSRWLVDDCKTKCETIKKTGKKLPLLKLLEIGLLDKENDHNTKVTNTQEEQLKFFMIETLINPKAFAIFFVLNGKGENDNMLQLRYYAIQKVFNFSIFESFITEFLSFYENISGNQENSILTWHEILTCRKQIDIQNLKTRNMNVNRMKNILSIYLQTKVSESLNSILKTGIAFVFNDFDSLTRIENDAKLEEEYIFKCIVYLNFPKNIIVENNAVYLERILMFSRCLEDNMKPLLEKRKLFKNKHLFQESEKKPIDFFYKTTKNLCFPIFETYEKIPLSMDFDDTDESALAKEISYKNSGCPELMNWDHPSPNTVKTQVTSGTQFIQNSLRYINGKFCDIDVCDQYLHSERKQDLNSSSNFKYIFEDFFNIRPQAILISHVTKRSEQTNPVPTIQEANFSNVLSEIKGQKDDLILKEEAKVTPQSFPDSYHLHKDNVEETKYDNQNNVANRNESEWLLQEPELANSKHFYPNNDSTQSVNHQFETNLRVVNNECLQELTAECLSTEALTIAKDFEIKSKFDLVLEELRMFHEISKENEILSAVETNNGQENCFRKNNDVEEVRKEIKKDLKMSAVNKICASPLLCDTTPDTNMHTRHQSLFQWKAVPESEEKEISHNYCCSRTSGEELCYSTSVEDYEKTLLKRPAFYSEFNEEKIHYLLKTGSSFSHGISRVQPLKTCRRPLRIGLSRKAKLKQLHPYLK